MVGLEELTPKNIVAQLDKYIVGQEKAKRSVAVALRNRYRRSKLADNLRDEVVPKNILLIGPTGVGKTEIARRLAQMVKAPFIKVEATKFTEVGYVGRDVETIIRELADTSVRMVQRGKMAAVEKEAEKLASERLIDILSPLPKRTTSGGNPLSVLLGIPDKLQPDTGQNKEGQHEEQLAQARKLRKMLRQRLQRGELEDELVEIEVEENNIPFFDLFSGAGEEIGVNFQELLGGMLPKKKKKRRVSLKVARRILSQEEAAKMIDMEEVTTEGIRRAEEMGIVFIDEMDKIAGREFASGPAVSREGVQRDILPIVEGSTIVTKYGPVRTDHILFIAAGAFHVSKPSDLIPELQGRFPLRVELNSLSKDDFIQILTKPQNALLKQYQALLETEGIKLHFTADAIEEIAALASQINEQAENIGARRLHTIMERLLEDISFSASEYMGDLLKVDAAYVQEQLGEIVKDRDLSRYIL